MIPKHIILSRKGFDSSAGGCASPIFDDGTMISIPIPEGRNSPEGPNLHVNFEDIFYKKECSLGPVVESLTVKKVLGSHKAHLDPDLAYAAIERSPPEWLPSLGQVAVAQTHLANNQVGEGDLLLFFGWFRRVKNVADKWQYIASEPDLHVLFGWLQIGEIVPVGDNPSAIIAKYPWLVRHPHLADSYAHWKGYENNSVYLARKWMSLSGVDDNKIEGGGVFPRFDSPLVLTDKGQNKRSLWRLPSSFCPRDKHTMTYHRDQKRWEPCPGGYLLQTAGRGQEFILETNDYPGAISWVGSLFEKFRNCY
jgi:hypothetical protein